MLIVLLPRLVLTLMVVTPTAAAAVVVLNWCNGGMYNVFCISKSRPISKQLNGIMIYHQFWLFLTHQSNQLTVNSFRFFSLILQVYYYIVDSPRNEGKEFFEINLQSGEVFTKIVFDREKQGAYALEVEARDGAPSARPNSNGQPNSGT